MSGNEEFTLEVTEEEYRNYYRPWWQQKKHEQRNREVMEQNGYTEESYEGAEPPDAFDHKRRILSKLRKFFSEHGFEVDSK